MRSMGIIVDDLDTAIEATEEEGDLILKQEFMMLIFKGIMDEKNNGPTCSKISLYLLLVSVRVKF